MAVDNRAQLGTVGAQAMVANKPTVQPLVRWTG